MMRLIIAVVRVVTVAPIPVDLFPAIKLGLSSIVELEQAQLNQTQAAIDQASAKYDYAAKTASLHYAIGLLR